MSKFGLLLSAAMMALYTTGAGADDAASKTAFDFEFTSIDGKPMPLSPFKGRVLLVVNVASFCGFTPQYKALEALHAKYEPQGFAVIGAPSDDFNQEPKSASEIKKFCEGAYGVTFPMTDKVSLSGANGHPFYLWAREQLGGLNAPKWNFHKYLVGRDGKLATSFFSTTAPDSTSVTEAIEAELAKPAPAGAALN
jgi:glutathione peroxidase